MYCGARHTAGILASRTVAVSGGSSADNDGRAPSAAAAPPAVSEERNVRRLCMIGIVSLPGFGPADRGGRGAGDAVPQRRMVPAKGFSFAAGGKNDTVVQAAGPLSRLRGRPRRTRRGSPGAPAGGEKR